MKILCVIPARYSSTRFPGKPLVEINGKSMIELVWNQCQKSKLISDCVVATDDERIFNHVISFGGNVVMTNPNHQSGTDRCNEALQLQSGAYDAIVNVQGDEPFIDEEYIDKICQLLINGAPIATLAHPLNDKNLIGDSNKVKVVKSISNKALYFSRSCIPFDRNKINPSYFGHIGIYGYSNFALTEISTLKMSSLEMAESLEQLRWLENDLDIFVDVVDKPTQGVDTPEDLERILKSIK